MKYILILNIILIMNYINQFLKKNIQKCYNNFIFNNKKLKIVKIAYLCNLYFFIEQFQKTFFTLFFNITGFIDLCNIFRNSNKIMKNE